MAYITTSTNSYVKFIRGTPTAWKNFSNVDNDTLYFISEPDAETGKLYLGSKLISGGNSSAVSLSDLQDVLLDNNITSNSLLVYDIGSNKWTNVSIEEVLSSIIGQMGAATAKKAGTSGLVPAPAAGQQALFLRGDATWANPTEQVEQQLASLIGNDTGTIRDIAADEVAKIVASAPEAYDTLKEIADWIVAHNAASDIVQNEQRLIAVENAVFGQEEVKDETTGAIITPASEGLQTLVTNLNTVVNDSENGLVTKVAEHDEKISILEEKMTWGEIVEQT